LKTYRRGGIIGTVGADPEEVRPLLERAIAKVEADDKLKTS